MGCNKNNKEKNLGRINFEGESEHWNAIIHEEYEEIWEKGDKNRLEYNHSVKQTLELIYKGKDDKKPDFVDFECNGPAGSIGHRLYAGENGNFFEVFYQGGNNATIAREHDTFRLIIRWEKDREEIIELKAAK